MRTIEEMREIWKRENCDRFVRSLRAEVGKWMLNAHRSQILDLYSIQELIKKLSKMDPRESQDLSDNP